MGGRRARRRGQFSGSGINIAVALDAEVAINDGAPKAEERASSHQQVHIDQRQGHQELRSTAADRAEPEAGPGAS